MNGNDSFLQWILMLANLTTQPNVHSVSYGEDADTVSFAFMQRMNQEFIKFGLMGVTFLFASGDYGVNCYSCGCLQDPTYPGVSPYVTSVGGATCGMGDDGKCHTSLQTDPITGSGWSQEYPIPSWGYTAMTTYLNNDTPPPAHTFFNTSGRAYPDIVALSEDYEFMWQGYWNFVGGTSCAAPVIAGMISLVNDRRIAAGKATLGFLNPLLYQLGAARPDVYIDITEGQRNTQGSCVGFSAAPGWDAISGWGGINFGNFAQAAMDYAPQ